MGSSDSFTNFEFRIYNFFTKCFLMIFFSTGKLRKIRGQNWGNKLVKTSDEFIIKVRNYLIGTYPSKSAVDASSLIKYIMSEVCCG